EADGDALTLAEEEVHRRVARQAELGFTLRAALFRDDDTLGQGVLVEGHGVGASLRYPDLPAPIGVGLGLGFEAVALDSDGHAFDGFSVELHVPAEVEFELLLGSFGLLGSVGGLGLLGRRSR